MALPEQINEILDPIVLSSGGGEHEEEEENITTKCSSMLQTKVDQITFDSYTQYNTLDVRE